MKNLVDDGAVIVALVEKKLKSKKFQLLLKNFIAADGRCGQALSTASLHCRHVMDEYHLISVMNAMIKVDASWMDE